MEQHKTRRASNFDFTRLMWTDNESRATWEPRIDRVMRAWSAVESLAVLKGIRRMAIATVRAVGYEDVAAEAASRGLVVLPFERRGEGTSYMASVRAPQVGEDFSYGVAITTPDHAIEGLNIVRTGTATTIGAELGYPACCVAFFVRTWHAEGLRDTTWAMKGWTEDSDSGIRTVSECTHANILWRWLGVRAVSHLPCSFECEASHSLGEALLSLGEQAGYTQEMQWVRDLLQMPVEWSAKNNIAEIRYPFVKVTARSIEAPSTLTLRYAGRGGASGPPRGLRYPYTLNRPVIRSAQRRMESATRQPNEWLDNGFTSHAGMVHAHSQLIESIGKRAREHRSASAIDLGCGNGALLAALQRAMPELTQVYGVELSTDRAQRARASITPSSGGVLWADFQRYPEALQLLPTCDYLLLMPGRLLEMEPALRPALLASIAARAVKTIVYAYGDVGATGGPLESMCKEAGLSIAEYDGTTAVVVQVPNTTELHAGPVNIPGIEWERMARPQRDGYDTMVVNLLRVASSQRAGYHPTSGELEGLAIRYVDTVGGRRLSMVNAKYPTIVRGYSLLRLWPEGALQVQECVDCIETGCSLSNTQDDIWGSTCSSTGQRPRVVLSVADGCLGYVEGIVHELAHHKLRTLGVDMEAATALVAPGNDTLYHSPVRYDKLRPLSAVLHAQYSYVYVLALYMAVFGRSGDPEIDRVLLHTRLPNLAPRLRFGQAVLQEELFTKEGRQFLGGLESWTQELLGQVHQALDRAGVQEERFVHPLQESE